MTVSLSLPLTSMLKRKIQCVPNLTQVFTYVILGNLYTEHIPVGLSHIMHVPFPDVLHLYNQAFNGFHRLSKRLGPFKVTEDCIGVNNNHVAKVWHSPDFAEV